jgi:hypothetical protein
VPTHVTKGAAQSGNIRYTVGSQAFKWQQNWQQRGNRLATHWLVVLRRGLGSVRFLGMIFVLRFDSSRFPACIQVCSLAIALLELPNPTSAAMPRTTRLRAFARIVLSSAISGNPFLFAIPRGHSLIIDCRTDPFTNGSTSESIPNIGGPSLSFTRIGIYFK